MPRGEKNVQGGLDETGLKVVAEALDFFKKLTYFTFFGAFQLCRNSNAILHVRTEWFSRARKLFKATLSGLKNT